MKKTICLIMLVLSGCHVETPPQEKKKVECESVGFNPTCVKEVLHECGVGELTYAECSIMVGDFCG